MSNFDGKLKVREVSYIRAWWLMATALAVALILGLGMLDIIRLLAQPLALLILGLTLAASLAPIISWLERRMPRLLATLLVYVFMLTILGGLIWWIFPYIVVEAKDLSVRLPTLVDRARLWIDSWPGNFTGDTLSSVISSELNNLGPTLIRLPLSITSALLEIILILFISFYALLEAPGMQAFLLSLFPEERRARFRAISIAMVDAMGGYFRGVVINGAIMGLLISLGLLVLGVDFALVFGVMAGLLEMLPVVGPIVAGVIIVGLTLLQSPGKALEALIFIFVMQELEGHVLVPNIMRSQTKISSLVAVLALFAGGLIGRLVGALIAIPIAAALRILLQQVIAPAIRKQTGATAPEELQQ